MNDNEPELSQFDRTQFRYLNLSCLFVALVLIVYSIFTALSIFSFIDIPIWDFLILLFFLITALVLIRSCIFHEVKTTDDNTLASI
jgi:uncharacterized membrane protein